MPALRSVKQREFEIEGEEVRAAYIHKEGVSGIESFVKGMLMMSLAQNDCEPQMSFRAPVSGVQSK